jgi:hypothetical protein
MSPGTSDDYIEYNPCKIIVASTKLSPIPNKVLLFLIMVIRTKKFFDKLHVDT